MWFKKKDTFYFKLENDDLDEALMNEMLEYGGKNNNKWFKSIGSFLFEPTNVISFHFEMAKKYFASPSQKNLDEFTDFQTNHSVKHCPAIGNGFLNKLYKVKLPTDVMIHINTDGEFIWKSAHNMVRLQSHNAQQWSSPNSKVFQNHINVKFVFDAFIQSPEQYMFLQPQYEEHEERIKVVTGVIDKSHIQSQPLIINTLVEIPKEHTQIYLKKGSVIAYMWFPRKMKMEYNEKIRHFIRCGFYGANKVYYQNPKK